MIDWQGDLQDQLVRDYINAEKFTAMCSKAGIGTDTTVVFYGDKSNWWACYAFWAFKLFGHADCRILNGGRKLWLDQERPTSTEKPSYPPAQYKVRGNEEARIRTFRDAVAAHAKAGLPLIDVRSPKEFTGEMLAHGGLSPGRRPARRPYSRGQERALEPGGQRRRHVQVGRASSRRSTRARCGLKPSDNVVAYCRIGERSSLTWFVLTYLLGYENVRNYDGSWTEWGNLVRAPIAKGA